MSWTAATTWSRLASIQFVHVQVPQLLPEVAQVRELTTSSPGVVHWLKTFQLTSQSSCFATFIQVICNCNILNWILGMTSFFKSYTEHAFPVQHVYCPNISQLVARSDLNAEPACFEALLSVGWHCTEVRMGCDFAAVCQVQYVCQWSQNTLKV